MDVSEIKDEVSPKKIFVSSFVGSIGWFMIEDTNMESVMANWCVKWIENSSGGMIEVGKRFGMIMVFFDWCLKDLVFN